MAQKSVQRTVTIIDPMFHIPEGVDELQYDQSDEFGTGVVSDDADEFTVFIGDEAVGYEDTEDNSDVPATPDIIAVSQTLRRLPTGEAVVDIVLEIEGSPGPTEYEVHITKA